MAKQTERRDKKTVYFSACGIGLGHVGRLKPFAREMYNEGHKIYFTGYGDSLDQLKDDKFTIHRVPKITFYENPDGSFNSVKTSVLALYLMGRFMNQVKTEYNYIAKYKPDIVVSDTRYSTVFGAKKYKMAHAPDMPILMITNQLTAILPTPNQLSGIAWFENIFSYLNIRIIGMADHVLVQDLPPPYTISTTSYKVPDWLEYRFQYIGFIIRKTPEQLPDRETLRQKYTKDDDKPLIYAPLAGPIVARKQLMLLLRDALKDFDGKVIISMGMFGNDLDKKYGNVHVKGWLKDRFELLKAADLTIARPGLATIGDFLRFGVPCILIPTLNHPEQLHNAKSVQRLGVGHMLEQQNLSTKSITQMIENTIHDPAVKKATKKMQKIMIKNNGLEKVRSIIKEKLEL
jgi:UDP:flavonoid glycosyltransferase YjiC (YdhE family)